MSLYGVYGRHTPETCPVNNRKIAEALVNFANIDLASVVGKYKINQLVGQYHSALEHTFLWVVDAEDPHLIEQFCIDMGIASFNYIKIVPLLTFGEGVIPRIKEIHGL
jgi:tetrahydromethanopterin S-methyltransferase subunit H